MLVVYAKYKNMLYTRKGDHGTTKLFNCAQGERLSKSDFVFEVLGLLDELNCVIGYAKVLSRKSNNVLSVKGENISYDKILEILQQNLFCIQAEIGGSDIHLTKDHVLYLEEIISEVEKVLPPINSFVVYGGGESSAYLDIARAVARRVERQMVLLKEQKSRLVGEESLIFLNRLSSVLYALARFANYQEGYVENNPNYK